MIHKYERIYDCYDELGELFRSDNRQAIVFRIEKPLLKEIVDFLKPLSQIFDTLEKTKAPTFNMVVPSYYLLKSMWTEKIDDSLTLKKMKKSFSQSIDNKLFTSITIQHWTATFLDPNLRTLAFIPGELKESKMEEIKSSMKIFYASSEAEPALPSPKKDKISENSIYSSIFAMNPGSENSRPQGLEQEISEYLNTQFTSGMDPLCFWKKNSAKFTILSKAAQSLLPIQASSSLSERIFSHAGKIDTPDRASLKPDTLSCLTRLKSAAINDIS